MKNKIIRHIKENYNIYDNIADSESIQYLINFLVPAIFKTPGKKPKFSPASTAGLVKIILFTS